MPADPQATYLSAFTGIGGLDLGLEAAGFTSIGCIEMDETACRSIKANRSGVWTLLSPGDITELSKSLRPKSLGLEPRELGVLSGGPPCQPFSKAGQWSTSSRTGLLDPRSRCLDGMLDLVQHFQPLVMLIENVGGFVSGPTSAWSKLIERLNRINALCATNYQPQCRILDAADFGVPQKRRRDHRRYKRGRTVHMAHRDSRFRSGIGMERNRVIGFQGRGASRSRKMGRSTSDNSRRL